MFTMFNFLLQLWGQKLFSAVEQYQLMHRSVTMLALSKEGTLWKSVSLYMGVSSFAQLGKQNGVVLFCCTRTGFNVLCFIIISTFIC